MQVSLAAARINAKLTQKQVADFMGVDKSTIVKWEKGKTAPKVNQFSRLCEMYKCKMDDIFLNV